MPQSSDLIRLVLSRSVLTSFAPGPNILIQERKFLCTMLKMSSHCWTHMTNSSSTILLKLGSKALLNKLRNLSLSLRRGPWRFWRWLTVVGLLKLASGHLRAQIRKSSEQQQLYKDPWESVLALKRLWKKRRGVCLSVLDFFKKVSETRASPT